MSNATYQKINWGWLNDYNGYKFAPITFVEQLYTEEGYSFKEKYNQKWEALENGDIVAGSAKTLVKLNEDTQQYDKITTQKNRPVCFQDGVPSLCDKNLNSNLFGNINVIEQEEYQPIAILEEAYTPNTYYSKTTNGSYEINSYAYDANTVYYEINPNYHISDIQNSIDTIIQERNDAAEIIKNYNSASISRDGLNTAINTYNKTQEDLKALITINGNTINGNTINGKIIKATEKFEGNLEGNAATATKLASAQTISLTGSVIGSGSFDGSSALTINTTTNHNHNELYIPLKPTFIELFPPSNAGHGGYIDFHYNGNDENYTSRIGCVDNILTIETFATNDSGDKTGAIVFDTASTIAKGDLYIAIPHLIKGTTHNYSKSILFVDETIINQDNRVGRIRSGISPNTDDNIDDDYGYIEISAYQPKAEGTSAQLYLHCYYDGSSEAGVTGDTIFMGAAWNDYAEFRDQIQAIEPGYCVASTDDGKVYKTTEKFQACDGIVSDTYGFSIGRSETYQTPLAVSGRVLAYCEGSRDSYHAGDTVCAGPEGKVCKMTREEIKEYPDRIVGIVSEIPEYEEWTGKKVNNRIWIKVR